MATLRNILPVLWETSAKQTSLCGNVTRILTRGVRSQARILSPPKSESSTLKNEPIENKDIEVNKYFYNRNPRALEYMGLAKKVNGWRFQYPPKDFFHRLSIITSNKHTSAIVEHSNGTVVVEASTKEIAISRHLHSNTDVSAAENIGRVIAQRCLQCGITNMTMLPPDIGMESEKFEKFETALTEGGVALWEPEEEVPHYEPGIDYEDPEAVANLFERQLKVSQVSEEHSINLKFRSKRPGSRIRTPLAPIKHYM